MKNLAIAVILLSASAFGADVCIRNGGSGDGSAWNNALSALPATLYRSNTYWLGNGTITAGQVKAVVPTSFTSTHLKIWKATVAAHGTSTGWSDSYAAQARMDSGIEVNYNGWFIDGVTYPTDTMNNGSNPDNYGILWDAGGDEKLISFGRNLGVISDNNIVRGVWFNHIGTALPGTDVARYHLDFYSQGATGNYRTNYVGYCGATNGSVFVFQAGNTSFNTSSNNMVEHCYVAGQTGNGANHAEPIDWYYTVHESTVRNCIFKGTRGGVSAIVAIGGNSAAQYGNEFYGNLVYDCETSVLLGFGESDRSQQVGARIYNNTIADRYNCCSLGTEIYTGSDNLVFNNLWINTQTGFAQQAGVVHTNNGYSWNYSSSGEIPNVPTSIFTDYSAKNFTLTTNYFSGASIAGMNLVDMLGNYRGGTNGTMSVGAFQLVSATNSPAYIIRNIRLGTVLTNGTFLAQ